MPFDRTRLPETATYFESRGLTLTGPAASKWRTTKCNFHGGSDSMRICIDSGGWVCMSCGIKGGDVLEYEIKASGATFSEAAKEIGAWVDDGRPTRVFKAAPLPPKQAFAVIALETTLIAIAACNLGSGKPLTSEDRQRLLVAGNRIITLAEAYK